MKQSLLVVGLTAAALVAGTASAGEHEVAQKDKRFTVEKLEIKSGDVVSFPNQDSVFHNVFSLSPAKTFDLGSYPKGETKKVTFDKPGSVEVECAIHPTMKMTIDVK